MASDDKSQKDEKAADAPAKPDWAQGLKRLYDSVVDEPLPDSFKDLLAQFDEDDDDADHSAERKS